MASLDDYHLGQVIAKGSFGAEIRHGRYKSDRNLHVSIKLVSKRALLQMQQPPSSSNDSSSNSTARLYGLAVVQEQKLLKRFSGNQCVPKLYACFHNPDFVITVTQCCTGGSLQQVITALSNPASGVHTKGSSTSTTAPTFWREHVALQLLDILVFLHTSSIVHCDLRPEVLHFTDAGNLRLVDFGYAIDLKQSNRVMIRHKTDYSSPELWNDEPTVSTAVDLWSTGCICFAMHATHSPFARPTIAAQELSNEEDAKPSAVTVADSASTPAATTWNDGNQDVGKRVAEFIIECNKSTKKHPKVLDHAIVGSPDAWRETIYELLHPDPLQRTQAAAVDTSGDLYSALRARFLALMPAKQQATMSFQLPVPLWMRQEEEENSSCEESSDTN